MKNECWKLPEKVILKTSHPRILWRLCVVPVRRNRVIRNILAELSWRLSPRRDEIINPSNCHSEVTPGHFCCLCTTVCSLFLLHSLLFTSLFLYFFVSFYPVFRSVSERFFPLAKTFARLLHSFTSTLSLFHEERKIKWKEKRNVKDVKEAEGWTRGISRALGGHPDTTRGFWMRRCGREAEEEEV